MFDEWFKFFIGPWRRGTRRLSFEGKGLYADLIVLWRSGLKVPNDASAIAVELGVRNSRTVARPLAELMKHGKVTVDAEGYLRNERADRDIAERAAQRGRGRPGPNDVPEAEQSALPFRPVLVHNAVEK